MSALGPGRFLGITAGALLILGAGVYGPATLLGPLPRITATALSPASSDTSPPPALPDSGASAIVSLDAPSHGSAPATEVLATAGESKPMPIASAAKLVTALVVLDVKPLELTQAGPGVTIGTADYEDYINYSNADARTVTVFPGETWTEREMLQALLLGSSNNHADSLARWAYGSVEAYVAAANAWLGANGMKHTHVADATGLDEDTMGTAPDLARLAALAAAAPAVAEVLADPSSALAGRRGVDNTTEYHSDEGVSGVSRSYTDAAGVCFLFTAQAGTAEAPFRFAGAFLGEPDYESLGDDVSALIASARAGIRAMPVLEKGTRYVRFAAPWGESASGVVSVSKTRMGWHRATSGKPHLRLHPFTSGRAGMTVGRVSVEAPGGTVSAPLVLDEPIADPGVGWRLTHPVQMVSALLASR